MIDLKLLEEEKPISLDLQGESGSGTKNYNDLENKPTINGVELQGDLTLEDLGIIVNAVKDILINGASIVNNGVANIPNCDTGVSGVIGFTKNQGLGLYKDLNSLYITRAANNEIDDRINVFKPIVPKSLDYAVKCALTDGKGATWTNEEKTNARNRMGLEWTLLGDVTVEEDGVTKIELPIDNPNYNEYQFYVYVADRKTPTAQNMNIGFDGLTSTSYCLTYAGVGTNTTYHLKGHAMRHCNIGWFTNALGSKDGKPCNTVFNKSVDYYYKDSTNPSAVTNTEKPRKITVSLSTGLDVGSKFVVYAR